MRKYGNYIKKILDLFLEARAEIIEKISLVFLEDLKTPKGHFKITRPIVRLKSRKNSKVDF